MKKKKTTEILAYRGNAIERMEGIDTGVPEEGNCTGVIYELGVALVRDKQEAAEEG